MGRSTMVSNGQRALWTFLIYALVGPFFAALALAAIIALTGAFGISSVLPVEPPALGEAAIGSYVWSTLPAVLTAAILAAVVWRTGGLSWLVAAAVAVIAFALAGLILPIGLDQARTALAILAGLVSLAVRQTLIQANIIPDR
ncbi:hypothetical protein APY04_1616 [Hyphomicrobium sulfonivorans]|uniref:Uncharacterized protein n=2 Tax=Hyphomicrobium sulfonivorans TaxID=121290 RepID=A0A109BIL9_HYPSL|nr:hypothetical protein APY04_1616 [Hyphomicrobium sulfonivorans]